MKLYNLLQNTSDDVNFEIDFSSRAHSRSGSQSKASTASEGFSTPGNSLRALLDIKCSLVYSAEFTLLYFVNTMAPLCQ